MLLCFLHVFLRISVLSGKTKSTLAMIFIGYFHINLHWWIFPLFNSAKNHTKDGHQSLARKVLEILIPIVSLFIFMLIFHRYVIFLFHSGCMGMGVIYKKLKHILIEREVSNSQLMRVANISANIISKKRTIHFFR